jgi:hypothetical protein
VRLPEPRGVDRRPDALLEVIAPDGAAAVLAVEEKTRLDPRDVRPLVATLKRAGERRPILAVARFLSPRTRELLREEGVNYLDATGNMHLALGRPGLFVETQGSSKDPESEPRPLRSLRGAAAGRIVRALCELDPPYGIRELAQRANTPLGSVARVAGLLDREALVERDESGRILRVQRPGLIRRWTQDYGMQRSNETMTGLAPRGMAPLLARLRDLAHYSITGSLAASRRISLAPARLATIYSEDPIDMAKALDVRPADAGANVVLLRPYDRVVFERTWGEEGLVFAALSQVAADLLTSPGRAPSEGEELLRWMGEHVDGWRA